MKLYILFLWKFNKFKLWKSKFTTILEDPLDFSVKVVHIHLTYNKTLNRTYSPRYILPKCAYIPTPNHVQNVYKSIVWNSPNNSVHERLVNA